MPDQPDYLWEVSIPKEIIPSLRNSNEFVHVLNLSRVLNALNFCYQAGLEAPNDESPASSRQKLYGIAFAYSVIYEGIGALHSLPEAFQQYRSYKTGLGSLKDDKKVHALREKKEGPLYRLRMMTFHFQASTIKEELCKEGVSKYKLDSYVLATGIGKSTGRAFYRLADDLLISHIIGNRVPPEEGLEIFTQLYNDILEIAGRFRDGAHHLIEEFYERHRIDLIVNDSDSTE